MNENKWPGDATATELSEEEKQEMDWKWYVPKMKFWVCCNLVEILFLLAVPFLIFYLNKMQYPGAAWAQQLSYYETLPLTVLLIILALSLTGMFFVFSAKDKNRLGTVLWLSLAGAVMMCFSFFLFRNGIGGHATTTEEKLYWFLLVCSLLHIVSGIRIFHAIKNIAAITVNGDF